MMIFLLVLIISCFSGAVGQKCQARFNESINGQCAPPDSCIGTVFSTNSCAPRQCCNDEKYRPVNTTCVNAAAFATLYNTSRSEFLRTFLSAAINMAGICSNCQAKAAFLAVAATMTEGFQTDEAAGTDAQFAADDNKYGNTQPGDGLRYRRRGFFGLRGRLMYERLQVLKPQYQSLSNPEAVAVLANAIDITSLLWGKPDLQRNQTLTEHADGTFYSFSILWYKLTGGIEKLDEGAKHYSKFLRALKCGGDLYPGQGPVCKYNDTHNGTCAADCIKGLEDGGEYCGCSGSKGPQCPDSPAHIRCCIDTCSQELKMDLGFVLDASGSVGAKDYALQIKFTKDLLRRANVGRNKTHVGVINYSSNIQTLTWLNGDYDLQTKLKQVDKAKFLNSGTNTAQALQEANVMFSRARGLRKPEEGVTPVIFIITDGISANRTLTIKAAEVLKNKSIILITVGVGNALDIDELHAVCTPPAEENYFSISDYTSLDNKLSQFTSKTCTEPAIIPSNTTVTGEISKDKYKFLKLEITVVGNKIQISLQLFNGKIKLFHSFTSRNPKDPKDFTDYQETKAVEPETARNEATSGEELTLVLDVPDTNVEFVYIGVKGMEENNKFEVKVEDCANIVCKTSKASLSTMSLTVLLLAVCLAYFFH